MEMIGTSVPFGTDRSSEPLEECKLSRPFSHARVLWLSFGSCKPT